MRTNAQARGGWDTWLAPLISAGVALDRGMGGCRGGAGRAVALLGAEEAEAAGARHQRRRPAVGGLYAGGRTALPAAGTARSGAVGRERRSVGDAAGQGGREVGGGGEGVGFGFGVV